MSATTSESVTHPVATLPPVQDLRRILEAGLQAPSAENRHYLRFEPLDDGLLLVCTDAPTWDALPHRRMLALVAIGAVVENLTLASAAHGQALAVRWFPEPARTERVAELRWTAAPTAVADPLAASIAERHTNRRFYRRQPVDAERLRTLAAAASSVPGAGVLWLDDPSQRRWALKAIRMAETERFQRRSLHDELFSAVRFELGWRGHADEGLPPGALEVEPPMRPLFASLRRWRLMRALTRLGVHHTLGLRAADLPCRLAPHLGLITCNAAGETARALGAGRALQRVWLQATAHGLAFQPMAAAPVLSRQRLGDGWVSSHVQDELKRLLQHLTGGRAESAYMFFRIGTAAPASLRTGRRPLDDHLAEPLKFRHVPSDCNSYHRPLSRSGGVTAG